jgi:hypothetical protein
VKQVGPIRMSSERPTPVDCLRELGRLIQRITTLHKSVHRKNYKLLKKILLMCPQKRPVDDGAVSHNANDVMMLRAKLGGTPEAL